MPILGDEASASVNSGLVYTPAAQSLRQVAMPVLLVIVPRQEAGASPAARVASMYFHSGQSSSWLPAMVRLGLGPAASRPGTSRMSMVVPLMRPLSRAL